ncbi:MAG: nucleotidyltransferase family protein [Phenylobacterium sp.]|uniref:nucleotidyltransferase family protein n=1 Tax=Phenylobacterium sp. TaxID=1871053 RepID=UPI00391BD555
MTAPYAALGQLGEAMQGRLPPDVDWLALIKLANDALMTPAVAGALLPAAALPDDVRAFLADVRARNAARNARLADQLTEAVGVLNRAGVEPVLLKGAALWAGRSPDEPFDRLLADLDLLVAPHEAARARAALTLHGYSVMAEKDGADVHAVAELARPQDAAAIDLHQRAPGPPGLAQPRDFSARCRRVNWAGVSARVPDPAFQVFLTILHDLFHDGDFWRGAFDLRHLHDVAVLAGRPEGVDWEALHDLAGTRLARHAVAAQLLAARRLFGARIPAERVETPRARLQHARRLAQLRWPQLRTPLAFGGLLLEAPHLPEHALANRAGRERVLDGAQGLGEADRLSRLRQILAPPATGKV